MRPVLFTAGVTILGAGVSALAGGLLGNALRDPAEYITSRASPLAAEQHAHVPTAFESWTPTEAAPPPYQAEYAAAATTVPADSLQEAAAPAVQPAAAQAARELARAPALYDLSSTEPPPAEPPQISRDLVMSTGPADDAKLGRDPG